MGGKLCEEIGVVPLVSDTTLVVDYLNAPLPTLCALTLGDLGLSLLFPLQSAAFQCMSQERCLLNWSHFFPYSLWRCLQFYIVGLTFCVSINKDKSYIFFICMFCELLNLSRMWRWHFTPAALAAFVSYFLEFLQRVQGCDQYSGRESLMPCQRLRSWASSSSVPLSISEAEFMADCPLSVTSGTVWLIWPVVLMCSGMRNAYCLPPARLSESARENVQENRDIHPSLSQFSLPFLFS